MKLELGSGFQPTPGFYHLDVNPNAPRLDYCAPAFPLPDFADGSVDELRAVDVLEHLSYRDTAAVLAEWHRVLRDDGRLYVQVPDAQTCMAWYFSDQAKLLERLPPELPQTPEMGLQWRLLGGHADELYVDPAGDWRWNAHYALFTKPSLVLALSSAGFEVESCETNPHPNLLCWAIA